MLMNVIKHQGDTSLPDVVEADTKLHIGAYLQLEYDWRTNQNREQRKGIASFTVTDIGYNMLLFPPKVCISLQTDDSDFIQRCGFSAFVAPESLVLERMRSSIQKDTCSYLRCINNCPIKDCWTGQIARSEGEAGYKKHIEMLNKAENALQP